MSTIWLPSVLCDAWILVISACENKNVKMTFESNKERIGSMIQKIVYIDEFNMDKYEIKIITREFGSHYTDLEKGIPKSIPMMNP